MSSTEPALNPDGSTAGAADEVPLASGPCLRVSFSSDNDGEQSSRLFALRPDRWERLEIALPAEWHGGGLRLDPGGSVGLLEIAGARILSEVLGDTLWESLGRDLAAGVRLGGGAQVLPNARRLRLLCVGDEAQIRLPVADLREIEEPLRLELGVRMRTALAPIAYTLQESARDIHELEDLRTKNERLNADLEQERAVHFQTMQSVSQWQLNERATRTELEEALTKLHAANEQTETLAAAVDAARIDGRQQVSALQAQLAILRAEAQEQEARWSAEVENARAHGQEQARNLTAEIENLRRHVRGLEAGAGAAGQHIAGLLEEIERAGTREKGLHEEMAALHQRMGRLDAELAQARQLAEENRGRVRSMQQSVSWKLTLPLRMAARALTGRQPASQRGA